MKTVSDEYSDQGNQDFAPLVTAIAEILDHIKLLGAAREEPSPASSRSHSPARALFQAPDSTPGTAPRGAGARSPSPAGILKRPCTNPSCKRIGRPDTGYCGKVCSLEHKAPCKHAKKRMQRLSGQHHPGWPVQPRLPF